MSFETISIETNAQGIATLTLARPEKHNAINGQMIADLSQASEVLARDDDIRAVVLAAEGRSFCAGGDLAWMRAQMDKDRAEKMADARKLANMLAGLNRLPKPLIARVQGDAYGGGIGLMSICDIVIAVQGCKFALSETRLGLIPATIGPFVVRRMGERFARQVFHTATPFDIEFALDCGLVSRAVAADDLDSAIDEEVSHILKTRPGAVAAAKALCLELGGGDPGNFAEITTTALADRWETQEARDAVESFLKRI